MVAKPLCPLYKNIIKPLDRARYPELRYIMLRKVFQNSHIGIQYDKEEEHIELIEAFNDKSLSQQDFLKKTQECTDEKELKMLRRYLIKNMQKLHP